MGIRFIAVLSVIAVLCIAMLRGNPPSGYGEARIGGTFTLADTHGNTVKDRDFRGRMMLVYMGYSHCPDICPMTLGTIGESLHALGPDANKVAAIFITLDPERDTPQALGSYLRSFDSRIIGLTGSSQAIDSVAKTYKAFYKKAPTANGEYMVDHSGFLYLMDGEGKYVSHFESGIKPADLTQAIRKHF